MYNEELLNLYSSPSIIKMLKTRRTSWAGHEARMRANMKHVGYWWESQKEIDLGRRRRRWMDDIKMVLRERERMG
jgi:hypothetical protein